LNKPTPFMRATKLFFPVFLTGLFWLVAGLRADQGGDGEENEAEGKVSTITGERQQSSSEDLRRRMQESQAASGFADERGVPSREEVAGISEGGQQFETVTLSDAYWFIRVTDGFVLVPRGSILHWPENLHSLVMEEPKGSRMRWHEFIRSQRSIAVGHPVTIEQVQGNESLERIKESYTHSRQMVIATYNGNPVGIKGNQDLPKDEEKAEITP